MFVMDKGFHTLHTIIVNRSREFIDTRGLKFGDRLHSRVTKFYVSNMMVTCYWNI